MSSLLVSYNGVGDVSLADLERTGGRLELESDSRDSVQCDRVIEYLGTEMAVTLLKEIHRVLRKKGKCQVRTADLEAMAVRYTRKEMNTEDFIRLIYGMDGARKYAALLDANLGQTLMRRAGFRKATCSTEDGHVLVMESVK